MKNCFRVGSGGEATGGVGIFKGVEKGLSELPQILGRTGQDQRALS